jgi:hypothetical protein
VDEIQAELNKYDVARSIFASYCGVPATRLGLCLDGARAWDAHDLAACQKVMREMIDLAKSIEPLPIDWRKVGLVRNVLEARRASKTFVVSTSSGLFVSLDKSYRPVFDQTGVPLTGEGAHRVCEELRKLNFGNVKAAERQLLAEERSKDYFAAWKPHQNSPTKK